MKRTIEQRWWPKVRMTDGCWYWTGARHTSGYGLINRAYVDGRSIPAWAHRVAYELAVGPIPEGMVLDHLCNNGPAGCVRPDHLEPTTIGQNVARGFALRTHCRHGHEYTPENTWRTSAGRRRCRRCTLDRNRIAYLRRKQRVA